MNKHSTIGLAVFVLLFGAGMLRAEAQDEVPVQQESGKPKPQKIDEEAKLLLRKVDVEMEQAPLAEALRFVKDLVNIDASVSNGAGEKTVTLKLKNATLAEALRQIKDQAGAVHRVVDGQLLIATLEEWAEIDKGKAKFETFGNARPTVDAGEISMTKRNSYNVGGKTYTDDELKKEKPEVWATLQAQGNPAVISTAAAGSQERSFSVNGKSYTEQELKKAFPDLYKRLVENP